MKGLKEQDVPVDFPDESAVTDVERMDPNLYRLFSNLEIGVITDHSETGNSLVRDLKRTRATVQHIYPCPDMLPTTFDIIFCDASYDLPQRLPWNLGNPTSALVLLFQPLQQVDVSLIDNSAPHAVLHMPTTAQEIYSSLIMARNLYRYERRLRQRVDKLDDNLRTMRNVERAKLILMHNKGISEAEAYNFLRKQAMDKQASIGSLATAIVDTQELLG